MAAGGPAQCLACQGKRVRAPSQAAINAAILAAQRAAGITPTAAAVEPEDGLSDDDDEDEGSESSGDEGSGQRAGATAGAGAGSKAGGGAAAGAAPTQVLSPEQTVLAELSKAAGGISIHTGATWMDAALRVLLKASTMH